METDNTGEFVPTAPLEALAEKYEIVVPIVDADDETDPQFIEDEHSYIVGMNVITDAMLKLIKLPMRNPYEEMRTLEAARIAAAIYGVAIPEGIFHKVDSPMRHKNKLNYIKAELQNAFFKDKTRESKKRRRNLLKSKIEQHNNGERYILSAELAVMRKELSGLNAYLKKKSRKPKVPDDVILATQEESNARMAEMLSRIIGDDVSNVGDEDEDGTDAEDGSIEDGED
jgi:hypothetical protein